MALMLLSVSCAGTNKRLKRNTAPRVETTITKNDAKEPVIKSAPIKEVEERVIPLNESKPNPYKYFVIIGSFRYPDNAKKYQSQLLTDGFSSEILRNEAGLYRVSVLATNEINFARDDIRRIRSFFPKYFDTWLLIQKE